MALNWLKSTYCILTVWVCSWVLHEVLIGWMGLRWSKTLPAWSWIRVAEVTRQRGERCCCAFQIQSTTAGKKLCHFHPFTHIIYTLNKSGAIMCLRLTLTSLGMRVADEEGTFEEEWEGRWPILPSSAEGVLLNWDETLNTVSPERPWNMRTFSVEAQIWSHSRSQGVILYSCVRQVSLFGGERHILHPALCQHSVEDICQLCRSE